MVVAQFVEQLLPTAEIRGSNPVIGTIGQKFNKKVDVNIRLTSNCFLNFQDATVTAFQKPDNLKSSSNQKTPSLTSSLTLPSTLRTMTSSPTLASPSSFPPTASSMSPSSSSESGICEHETG